MNDFAPSDDIQDYYATFPEEERLSSGASQLERDRTRDVLARVLPAPPCRVVDVGGAAGVYSLWLAERGYEVHLVDASPRLIEEARSRSARATAPITSISVGDARQLPRPDESAEAVLVMGPLYHLTDASDRVLALREALRVLAPGGVLIAAAVSRFASAMDGFARNRTGDPAFRAMRDRDLADGQHRNPSGHPEYFTTAYFHRPEDLVHEVTAAGFRDVAVLGVEGPTWILPQLDRVWNDEVLRRDLLDVTRVLEREPSVIGASAHLLGIGTKAG
jgi:ubiquinone/menaquinone biosynthesis C-methylase UbiE